MSHHRGRALLAVAVAMVLGATLFPVPGADPMPPSACIICGSRGLADAILNVLLFVPLGMALSLLGWRGWRVVAVAAFFSLAIEVAQTRIPGRDPSWGDLTFNALGGAAGHVAARFLPRSLSLPVRSQTGLWLVALAGALGVIPLTGYLAGPSLPPPPYYGQWAVDLPVPWYHFDVRNAWIDGQRVPPHRLADAEKVREALTEAPRLDVVATALPRGVVPRRIVSIFDPRLEEVFWLGSVENDLVLRYRSGATFLRLDTPEYRFRDVLRGIDLNDSVRIVLSGEWRQPCVTVNRHRTCADGMTVGSGWRFLLHSPSLLRSFRPVLNAGWILMLFFPVGLWGRTGWRMTFAGAFLLVALVLLPEPLGLARTPVPELFAGAAGLFLGIAAGRRARSRREENGAVRSSCA